MKLRLDIQLSGGEGGPINRFDSATFVCMSQARTWSSNVICRGSLLYSVKMRFVDIGGIDNHHCLNFLFTIAIDEALFLIIIWTHLPSYLPRNAV